MLTTLTTKLFWLSVWLGKPFGGIRPRRLTHWLARRAFGGVKPKEVDFRWYRDRFGISFLLHPHFQGDYQIIAFGAYYPLLADYIDRNINRGMVCLDVGAHVGYIGLQLAKKVGPTGRVYCFEPVPSNIKRLRQHIDHNGFQSIMKVHEFALSDRSGELTMSIASEDDPNQGMGSLVATAPQLQRTINVTALTLDDFVAQEGLGRLDFIKVDIQGAEPLFLEGGKQTFATFRPDIVMEVSPLDLAGLGKTSRDLFAQLETLGYRCYTLRRGGKIGRELLVDHVSADYVSDGILCRHKAWRFGWPSHSSSAASRSTHRS